MKLPRMPLGLSRALAWISPIAILNSLVSQFDLDWTKLHRVFVSEFCQLFNDWSAGITQAQELGDFIECFTRRVIECVTHWRVSPASGALGSLHQIQMRMATGDHKR